MRYWRLLIVLSALILPWAAAAQLGQGGEDGNIRVGAKITGCTNGYFVYDNSGVVGCSASSSSIGFPQAVTGGTSGGVPYFSSATQLSASAALAINQLVIGGGAGAAPSTVTTGTGVLAALAIAPQTTGSFARQNGAITNSDCLQWSSTGIQDAGAACGSGGGTPSFPVTVTGTVTSGGVAYFNSTTQESSSALLTANALMIGGGAGVAPSTATTGTSVLTALGVNVGTAGSVVVNGGALGTPSGGTLTSATGLPISTGLTGAGTGVLTALGNNLNAASGLPAINGSITAGDCLKWSSSGIQDQGTACGASSGLTVGSTSIASGTNGDIEYNNSGTLGEKGVTGSGNVVLATSPSLTTPNLGTPSAINLSNGTALPLSAMANLGTTTTVLHGNAAGNPAFSAVNLATDVTGVSPITINAQTGTTYTVLSSDNGKLVTLANSSGVAVTLPQATGSFTTGFWWCPQNAGTGSVVITPTTSTINGASTLTLASQQGVCAVSDGTNWQVNGTFAAGSSGLTVGSTTIASGTNGDIEYNNSGTLGEKGVTGTGGVVLATSPTLTTPSLGTPSAINISNATGTFGGTVGGATVTNVQGSSDVQSGTTYTLVATDCGKTVLFTSNSAITVTIPASIVPASGTTCVVAILQGGTSKVAVNGSAVSAATLISAHSYTGTSGTQGAVIDLTLTTVSAATNAYLTGDGS